MCPVVDHLARTGHGSGFKKIDSEPVTPEDAVPCADPIAVKILYAALCNVVSRESCYEFRLYAVVGKRYRHICFSASEGGCKFPGL